MTRPRRTLLVAFGLYVVVTLACALTTAPERLSAHTPYNHFALLADSWLHGRLDLGGPPPGYTGNNDFALLNGRWFVSFPPVPAVLIAPFVALSGGAEATRDGLFWLLLAGVGPAVLFLALDKLSKTGRSERTERENAALALVFALGTVYWFTAVQGTVWFAAHVVGVALTAGYLYASLDAAHPVAAGLLLALAFGTRPSLGYAFPLFLFEAYRTALPRAEEEDEGEEQEGDEEAAGKKKKKKKDAGAPGRLGARPDAQALVEKLAAFGAPVAIVVAILIWHNRARFGDPFEFGHRLLQIGWKGRIDRWGLFSYHYLGRNLGVALTSLPFTGTPGAPFQVNAHGLALWVTSPFYAWALWPRRTGPLFWALAATAFTVALPSLLYQNTGWMQFGFRFSNDFAPFLFALIAVGGRRLSIPFWVLVAWAVLVNGFGAVTFQRGAFARYYFVDGSQRVLYQPD